MVLFLLIVLIIMGCGSAIGAVIGDLRGRGEWKESGRGEGGKGVREACILLG
jgi:hypothetical protein